ncbi:hypothetical protein ZWY2020_016410 [Hordeum vulgare]|nr:hypothetical protein ZWY2020_016410 [Hordeum vulgare]
MTAAAGRVFLEHGLYSFTSLRWKVLMRLSFPQNLYVPFSAVPGEYFCALDASGRRYDTDQRPNLMVVVRYFLQLLFGIIFCIYATCICCLYHSSLSQPQMMVVTDMNAVFLPLPDELLVNLVDSRHAVDSFLDRLPLALFQDNINLESSPDDVNACGTDKEHILKIPEYPFYKQIYIHKHTGHFMLRFTDLLALPAVNSAFAMQLSLQDTLMIMQTVYYKVALLYTSSSEELRIRVHTAAAPMVTDLAEMYRQADTGAIVSVLARIGQYLPLYILVLCKSLALRDGYADVSLDERCAAGFSMMILPARRLLNFIYPSLYRLDEVLTVEPDRIDGSLKRLPLTLQCLDTAGLYLLDAGFTFLVWLGRMLQPELMNDILGVSLSNFPDLSKIQLRECDNNHSRNFMAVLRALRERDSSCYQPPRVVRQGEQPREGFLLLSNLVEDQMAGTSSYMDWILQIHRQTQSS